MCAWSLAFGSLFEQTIVAPVQRYRVIPDLGRNVNRPVQVPEPFAAKHLELEGLTHTEKASRMCVDESIL